MNFVKKKRQKPLYKKFLTLRKNVQNRYKILKFKKRKWKTLITQIKRIISYKKKNYRMYDLNCYQLPKYYKFKRKFSYNHKIKKRFNLFYGSLLKNYLKKQVKLLTKKVPYLEKNSLNSNKTKVLLELLENRIDIVLYRSHFTLSIKASRQLILHGHVKVNNTTIKNSSYILKKGDLVKLNHRIYPLLLNSFGGSNLWPIPPKYLHINYKTFQIIVIDSIKNTNFSVYFPFYPNLQTIIKDYSL